MNTIYIIIITFYIGQIAAACITTYYAFKVLRLKYIPINIKFFALYPILALSIGIPNILNDFSIKNLKHFVGVLNNVTLLLHISLIGFFIFSCLKRKEIKRLYLFVLIGFQLIVVFYLISVNLSSQNFIAFAITNFGLIVLTLFYFFEIFINPPILKLKEEPSFWIITGVFFSTCLNMPFYATYKVILDNNDVFIKSLVGVLVSLSYIIMFLFFVKGFKCSIKN